MPKKCSRCEVKAAYEQRQLEGDYTSYKYAAAARYEYLKSMRAQAAPTATKGPAATEAEASAVGHQHQHKHHHFHHHFHHHQMTNIERT